MSISVSLDGHDITALLNKQYPLPDDPVGILPDISAGKWYDMLEVINAVPELKNGYFQGGVHKLTVRDSQGRAFDVKILLRTKYSARNH